MIIIQTSTCIFIVILLMFKILLELYKFKNKLKTKYQIKEQSSTLCGHEIKSLLDQYYIFICLGCLMIIVSIILYFNDRTLSYKHNYYLIEFCFSMYLFSMFYLVSELKHLSPKDSIGKIASHEVKNHFIKIFIFSIINLVLAVNIMVNLLKYVEVIAIIITSLLISILNLGDLFQNKNDYNSKDNFISFSSSTIYPIYNFIKVVIDKKYKRKVINSIKKDISNIYLGLIELLRILEEKLKTQAI